jgi:NAD(P)H dehydrogenase (quinone)
MSDTLLVTGAGGQLGRQTVEALLKTGGAKVIAATRDPSKIADLKAKGAETRRIDFDDDASLADAFKGVDRVLIVSTDSLDSAIRVRQHAAAAKAAKAAQVKRIFYTSMINPAADSPVAVGPVHAASEAAIRETGLPYTFLRVGWYQENLRSGLSPAFASGTWYSAAGQGRLAHVARADVAAVAAAAMLRPAEGNEALDITGPKLLTTDEIAAIAAKTVGRPLKVVHVTLDQLVGGMVANGVPEGMARFIASFDSNTRAGKSDVASDVVKRLTGRAPGSLEAYFAEEKAAFV